MITYPGQHLIENSSKPFTKAICFHSGAVFDGKYLYPDGYLVVENGRVKDLGLGSPPRIPVNFSEIPGLLLMPGLVDLHSDALEKSIEARPGVFFEPEFAIQSLEQRLLASGITTFCHAISFTDNVLGLRSPERAKNLVNAILKYNYSNQSRIRHLIHIRLEVGSTRAMEELSDILDKGSFHLFSIMDHSPGQGQFKTMQSFLNYYTNTYAVSDSEAERIGQDWCNNRENSWRQTLELVQKVSRMGIPVLSHDDDTREKVSNLNTLGVSACEFPVSLEAAEEAKKMKMKVFMGSPNLIRGKSSNNNLSAAHTLEHGLLDGLVSDYSPESLLQSPFIAKHRLGLSLQETLRKVTLAPAEYLGNLPGSGTLYPGNSADFILVDPAHPWVRTRETWIKGSLVFANK